MSSTSSPSLANLCDVLFVSNSIYEEFPKDQCRIEVIKHLTNVPKIWSGGR